MDNRILAASCTLFICLTLPGRFWWTAITKGGGCWISDPLDGTDRGLDGVGCCWSAQWPVHTIVFTPPDWPRITDGTRGFVPVVDWSLLIEPPFWWWWCWSGEEPGGSGGEVLDPPLGDVSIETPLTTVVDALRWLKMISGRIGLLLLLFVVWPLGEDWLDQDRIPLCSELLTEVAGLCCRLSVLTTGGECADGSVTLIDPFELLSVSFIRNRCGSSSWNDEPVAFILDDLIASVASSSRLRIRFWGCCCSSTDEFPTSSSSSSSSVASRLTTIIKAEPVPESSHSRSWRWSSAFKESGVDRLFKKRRQVC